MAFVVPSLTYSRCYPSFVRPKISDAKHFDFGWPVAASAFRQPCLKSSIFGTLPRFFGKILPKVIYAATPVTPLVGAIDVLNAFEDEYGGVVVNPTFLPNAFTASLQSSLSYWSQQAGFIYHHAEPGYVMLTFWLPDGPSALPSTALHQIGIGAFVMNDKRKMLVVKERKCPLHCSFIWKIPTGFIDKIETSFLDVVAFRHAHQVTFEKSDIFFLCTLKPLSFDISVDESEIEAAKWMPVVEFLSQPFHQEDEMCKTIIDICITKHQKCYQGFDAHQVMSKLDNRVSYLYFGDTGEATGIAPETKSNEEETAGVFPTAEGGPVEIFGINSTN